MLIIRTLQDVHDIRAKGVLPVSYMNAVATYAESLIIRLAGKVNTHTYSLENNGEIFILTDKDDARNLPIPGLTAQEGGLLASHPEFCKKLELEGLTVWQVFLVCNNEFVRILFMEAGLFGSEVDQWLMSQEDSNIGQEGKA